MSDNITLSIITVVLDAADGLQKTLNSLDPVRAKFLNYEHIVIDGGSRDGTIDVIQNNIERISYWISESDDGIYNAMNKGIYVSKGIWCWFLNAGDTCLVENFEELYKLLQVSDSQLIKSGVLLKGNNGTYKEYYGKYVPPHQGCIYKREKLLELNGYDDNYKIIGDKVLYDHFVSNKYISEDYKFPIAFFDNGGFSKSEKGIKLNLFESLDYLKQSPFHLIRWVRFLRIFIKYLRIS